MLITYKKIWIFKPKSTKNMFWNNKFVLLKFKEVFAQYHSYSKNEKSVANELIPKVKF